MSGNERGSKDFASGKTGGYLGGGKKGYELMGFCGVEGGDGREGGEKRPGIAKTFPKQAHVEKKPSRGVTRKHPTRCAGEGTKKKKSKPKFKAAKKEVLSRKGGSSSRYPKPGREKKGLGGLWGEKNNRKLGGPDARIKPLRGSIRKEPGV